MQKNKEGGYDAPGGYDMAGGAMWLNKLDNLLSYHRPEHHKDPQSKRCELHVKKIKRQNIVGKLGILDLQYSYSTRSFSSMVEVEESSKEIDNFSLLNIRELPDAPF